MLGVALLVCVLPGLAVTAALGVRRLLLLVALAAPVSVAVAGLTATVTGALGLGFGAAALGIVTAGGAAVAAIRRARSRDMAPPPGRRRPPSIDAVQGLGLGLTALGVLIGVFTWLRGLGGLATVAQEHDTVVHLLLTSYIARTGRGAPWQVLPADLLTGEPVYFYPDGMHLLAAVVTDLTGDAVSALNAVTIVLLAVVLSVSAAALTVVAARRLELATATAVLAGGVAAVVAAGIYRPTFHLAHDGGLLPSAVALAMTPAVVAALLLLPGASRRAAVAVGLACVGIVWVHPSAAVSVGVTVVAWWLGDAVTRSRRGELRRLLAPLTVTALTAAVLLVPLLVSSSSAVARTSAFPADTRAAGYGDALGSTLGLAYGGYLDPERTKGQLWAALLLAVGVGAVLTLRRGFGPVTAWATWVGITIAYLLSPESGPETLVTGLLYKALVRIWSHVSLLVPVLCALGVVLITVRVAMLVRRRTSVRAAWTACLLVILFCTGYTLGPGRSYAVTNAGAMASRYAEPAFVRVGPSDLAAATWLAARAQPGQRVMNSANDGSTILYVEHDIPIVNVYPLGLAAAPHTYELLRSFNRYPQDPAVRRMIVELNVAWVYIDSDAPTIGASGSPDGWAGDDIFVRAPGLEDLAALRELEQVFRDGTVTVYSVDVGRIAALG